VARITETPKSPIPVTTADGCQLVLRNHPGPRGSAVLLLHGASAGSDTFRIGEGKPSLVDYLVDEQFDVWTLDWRASMNCAKEIFCRNPKTSFTIDAAATHDVPAAIATMRGKGVEGTIALVGHCMGGAIVAQGIAVGAIAAADVENVVLTALGLFYKNAPDDVLKAEDQSLEQILSSGQHLLHPTLRWDPAVCTHNPGPGDWDPLLQGPYEVWLDTPLPHNCDNALCHRLSYMFGMPFVPGKIPTIHKEHLPHQFGYIPVQFLLHCCQNLRRGYAAPFVANNSGATLPRDDRYLKPEAFRERRITLITGDVNSLWHRDSIDTMYEWLRRGTPADQPRALRKHVIPGFGHQDLHWAGDAPRVVFPLIRDGLRRP
jgi:cholesterol oxidase